MMKRIKMMILFFAPIALAVLSNVMYHLFQKGTPANTHPLIALAVTYATALVTCLLLLPFFPGSIGVGESLSRVNWVSVGLGIVLVGLEVGFLLAYRIGWRISLAGLVTNVAVGILLLPVGILLFKERVSVVNGIGILVCLVGIVMVNMKTLE